MTERFVNNTSATLNGAISSSQTTLVVSSVTPIPGAAFPTSGNFRIVVDSGPLLELMLVTAVSGTTLTVTRGIEGTTGVAHGSGVAVTQVLTAGALAQLIADNAFTPGGDLTGNAVDQYVTSISGSGGGGGVVDVGATVNLTALAGAGGLTLAAWTGNTTLPTGAFTWAGASTKAASLVSTSAAITITAGTTLALGAVTEVDVDINGVAVVKYTAATADFQNSAIKNAKTVTYDQLFDNGNSGTSKTITWTNGQKQKITLTGNCTATLVAPNGPCNLMLKVIQNGAGGFTLTLTGVKWPGGTAPTFTSAANAVDLVGLFYDGSTFYGTFAQAFA